MTTTKDYREQLQRDIDRAVVTTKDDANYLTGLLAEFLDECTVFNNHILWDAACTVVCGDAYRTMPTDHLLAVIKERARKSRAGRGLLRDIL